MSLQLAVVVNDMADVNVDGAVLAGSAEFRAATPRLVELSSGCVCCTLRADLVDVRAPPPSPPRPRCVPDRLRRPGIPPSSADGFWCSLCHDVDLVWSCVLICRYPSLSEQSGSVS